MLFSTPPNEGRKDQEGGTTASTRSTENLKIGKQLLPPLVVLAISVTLVLLPATVGGTDKKEAKFVVGDHVRRDHVLGADLSLSLSLRAALSLHLGGLKTLQQGNEVGGR